MFKLYRTFPRAIHQWPPKKPVEQVVKESKPIIKFFMDKRSKEFVMALADEIIEKLEKQAEKDKQFEVWNESPKPGNV
jgi:hypothetical protein